MGAKRVLVIDDSEDIREAYEMLLQHEGYEVATAANGEEGLRVARSFHPDIMTVDVVMPVMDGLEFLLHLRSDFAPPLPPVILCSGFTGIESSPLPQGAYAFVPKPISAPDFLKLLADALEKTAPDEATLARGRERSAEARSATIHAAQTATLNLPIETLVDSAGRLLRALCGYFDASDAFAAVIHEGSLKMISPEGAGAQLTEPPPSIGDVIATGSTLVLADVRKHPTFAADLQRMAGVCSFLGVPIAARSGVTTGALCLARRRIEPFETEDVLLLQLGARRAAELLERVHHHEEDPFQDFPFIATGGAFHASVFRGLVDIELRLAAVHEDSVELVIMDLGAPVTSDGIFAIRGAIEPRRCAIGELGPQRLAIFKRSREGARGSEQIDKAAQALSALTPLQGMASVAVASSSVEVVDAPMLFRLVDRQLARTSARHRIERLHVGAAAIAVGAP